MESHNKIVRLLGTMNLTYLKTPLPVARTDSAGLRTSLMRSLRLHWLRVTDGKPSPGAFSLLNYALKWECPHPKLL